MDYLKWILHEQSHFLYQYIRSGKGQEKKSVLHLLNENVSRMISGNFPSTFLS